MCKGFCEIFLEFWFCEILLEFRFCEILLELGFGSLTSKSNAHSGFDLHIRQEGSRCQSCKLLSAHFRQAPDTSQITCRSGSNLQNDRLWRDFSRPYRACYVSLMHHQDWSFEAVSVDLWYLKWLGALVHTDPCISFQGTLQCIAMHWCLLASCQNFFAHVHIY